MSIIYMYYQSFYQKENMSMFNDVETVCFFTILCMKKEIFYFNTLKSKQIIYGMINFIPSFREPFPLSRITASNIMLMFLIKIYIT